MSFESDDFQPADPTNWFDYPDDQNSDFVSDEWLRDEPPSESDFYSQNVADPWNSEASDVVPISGDWLQRVELESERTSLVFGFFSSLTEDRVGWGFVLAATMIAGWFGLRSLTSPSSPAINDVLYLSGKSVRQLRTGADVVWGELTIGRVSDVNIDGVNPTATLNISPKYRARLSNAARFEVGSLNPILPGNVGVIVTDAGGSTEPLMDSHVQARARFLPVQTPLGFWLVLGMALLTGFVGIAVKLQAISVRLFWKALAAFLLTLAIHLCCRTIANVDTVKHWSSEFQDNFQQNLETLENISGY